jgi:ArsR family transcriptional regulator
LRPEGVLIVVDFAPHTLEFLREEQAHRRLGFADGEVADWCRAAGLDPAQPRHLAGDPLTVAIWTAYRRDPASQAQISRRNTGRRIAPTAEALLG